MTTIDDLIKNGVICILRARAETCSEKKVVNKYIDARRRLGKKVVQEFLVLVGFFVWVIGFVVSFFGRDWPIVVIGSTMMIAGLVTGLIKERAVIVSRQHLINKLKISAEQAEIWRL